MSKPVQQIHENVNKTLAYNLLGAIATDLCILICRCPYKIHFYCFFFKMVNIRHNLAKAKIISSTASKYFFFVLGVSQPLSEPHLPEPKLAVHTVAQLTRPADHDYVTSLLAAWGQLLMDDLVITVNGNKVSMFLHIIILKLFVLFYVLITK